MVVWQVSELAPAARMRARAMTGAELLQARKDRGLSRPALAKLTGLHPDTIRYWERRGSINPKGYAPSRILVALGLGVSPRHNRRTGKISPLTRARVGVLVALGKIPAKVGGARCGARTRKGLPCRAKALPGKARCKFHGGASTGPRTPEGKARIADAQRRRWATWRERRFNDA